jgi:hypothetical protein
MDLKSNRKKPNKDDFKKIKLSQKNWENWLGLSRGEIKKKGKKKPCKTKKKSINKIIIRFKKLSDHGWNQK